MCLPRGRAPGARERVQGSEKNEKMNIERSTFNVEVAKLVPHGLGLVGS